MSRLAAIFVGIVAVIHLIITVIEMFFWMLPDVYHTFNFSEAEALKAQPIVRNVGLYNAFLAAGLIWVFSAVVSRFRFGPFSWSA